MLQFEAKIGGEERGEKKSASSTTQWNVKYKLYHTTGLRYSTTVFQSWSWGLSGTHLSFFPSTNTPAHSTNQRLDKLISWIRCESASSDVVVNLTRVGGSIFTSGWKACPKLPATQAQKLGYANN
jgi:hypothetical protein